MEKPAKFGKWVYYINDEGKARWKCSLCGKVIRHGKEVKFYCSNCGARLTPER